MASEMQEVFQEEDPMIELTAKWWCRTFHTKTMRPVRGYYRCAECLHVWPVNWDLEVLPTPKAGKAKCADLVAQNAEPSVEHALA
jgi:hypothetical protein